MSGIVCILIGVAACGDDNPPVTADAAKQIDAPVVIVDAPPDAPPDACACAVTATGATRGGAIAISPDDSTLVSVNRDVGTVTVAAVSYADTQPAMTKTVELDVGGADCEPSEVTIDACGKCAYVVTRKNQRVVRIENLKTTPTVGAGASVGSEPTSVALTPNGTSLYVANWVDGTLTVVNPQTMAVTSTVDLNAALVATNTLGAGVTARPALAHPRDLAITNNGDTSDADENVIATEFYAQRTTPNTAAGANADTNHKGLVYKVPTAGGATVTIDLPPVVNTGFNDHNDAATGCYPNQVSSVTVNGTFAWVTSTCASPKGPVGVFTGATGCLTDANCGALGGVCNLATVPTTCNANPTDVKASTHGAMSVVNLTANTATTTVMDKLFDSLPATLPPANLSRLPLSPTDTAFKANFAYVTGMGTDAAFRLTTTATGTISAVGSATNKFINLRRPTADTLIRLPMGIAIANATAFAFVNNEGSRDITAIDLNAQAIAGVGATDFRILQASALPTGPADTVLKGKRFFFTGLGRWSLAGAGWGSCGACHPDGLSDNVTWFFGRGPRQTTSLDGSFASADPNDQRIFNWTSVFDEVADFEGNVRGTSGGLGALVTGAGGTTRINTGAETPPQQNLLGSSDEIADPAGVSGHVHTVLADWVEIKAYMRSIRSPRAATGFAAADVAAGAALFAAGAGNCIGCHSGAKWTISKRFYTPGDGPNAVDGTVNSLNAKAWDTLPLNGFPAALLPVAAPDGTNARMRFGTGGAEQLQCMLRPVGTFQTSDASINVIELRQDMTTPAQGAAVTGRGFNPPSLLGLQVGGPFFHAGNARTLEEVFNARFALHHQSAIAQVFAPNAAQISQLVAFMLSVDESTPPVAIPALGATGGDFCAFP